MSEALVLDAIEKTYNRGKANALKVLEGASLNLMAGEVVALVAPSGAGKSTPLHIAGLLDSCDTGRVLIGGADMTGKGDAERTTARRQDVGFIYQFHHLLPEFSAVENVVLPQLANAIPERATRDHAMSLLDRVGVANKPKVLLADEPTGNLDPATSDTVFEALMELVRETGLAALIATHNPNLAARMDRTVRLDNGRLVS